MKKERNKQTLRKKTTNGFIRIHIAIDKHRVDLQVRTVHDLFQTLNHLSTRRRNTTRLRVTYAAAATASTAHYSLSNGFRSEIETSSSLWFYETEKWFSTMPLSLSFISSALWEKWERFKFLGNYVMKKNVNYEISTAN